MLKGKFEILGKIGCRLAEDLSAISGIETTISRDYIRTILLQGHKWKDIEPLIIKVLSKNIVPS